MTSFVPSAMLNVASVLAVIESILSPKTHHSLKCVVMAVTVLAPKSMVDPPSGAVQTLSLLLYMKRSDASLAPA